MKKILAVGLIACALVGCSHRPESKAEAQIAALQQQVAALQLEIKEIQLRETTNMQRFTKTVTMFDKSLNELSETVRAIGTDLYSQTNTISRR